MKRSIRYRYKGSSIDFMQDGMSERERIKGKDKKKMKTYTNQILKKDLKQRLRDI